MNIQWIETPLNLSKFFMPNDTQEKNNKINLINIKKISIFIFIFC